MPAYVAGPALFFTPFLMVVIASLIAERWRELPLIITAGFAGFIALEQAMSFGLHGRPLVFELRQDMPTMAIFVALYTIVALTTHLAKRVFVAVRTRNKAEG